MMWAGLQAETYTKPDGLKAQVANIDVRSTGAISDTDTRAPWGPKNLGDCQRNILRNASERGVAVFQPEIDARHECPLRADPSANPGACLTPVQCPISCRRGEGAASNGRRAIIGAGVGVRTVNPGPGGAHEAINQDCLARVIRAGADPVFGDNPRCPPQHKRDVHRYAEFEEDRPVGANIKVARVGLGSYSIAAAEGHIGMGVALGARRVDPLPDDFTLHSDDGPAKQRNAVAVKAAAAALNLT